MAMFDFLNKNKSSNAVKGMMAVQRIKENGTVEKLSKSQIVSLVTNLQDADKNLNKYQFDFVRMVFNNYRKQTDLISMDMFGYLDACKEIIAAYETNVPYFLFDGNYSEHLTKEMVQDIWVLYDDGLRFEDMEALIFRGRITEKVNEIKQKNI